MITSRNLSFSGGTAIVISFLFGLLLSILPLSNFLSLFWPQWLPLIVIFWVFAIPQRVNVGIAWFLGLLLDVLYGSVLGEHALAMSVVAFLASRLHQQIRMFPPLQQALSVGGLIFLYQMILICIQGMLGLLNSAHWFWVSTIVSALLWPGLSLFLNVCQRRFRVA